VITGVSCGLQTHNTMRESCDVSLSTSSTVQLGYRVHSVGGAYTWGPTTGGTSVTLVAYNFTPDTEYDYEVRVGDTAPYETSTGTFTPYLPDSLTSDAEDTGAGGSYLLDVSGAGGQHSNFVLFDTLGCDGHPYMVAVRPDSTTSPSSGTIVWYLDVDAESTWGASKIKGWSYDPHDKHIYLVADQRYAYEFAMDGTEVTERDYSAQCSNASGDDGPCPHHDIHHSADTDRTYVLVGDLDTTDTVTGTWWEGKTGCTSASRFSDDGWEERDAGLGGSLSTTVLAMEDLGFDPSSDAGPNPDHSQCTSPYWTPAFDSTYDSLDWTHVNSIYTVKPSGGAPEFAILSVRNWDQIVKIDTSDGSIAWTLSPNASYSSFGTIVDGTGVSGPADFGAQHAVTDTLGVLQMFDNRGGVASGDADLAGRVIQIDFDGSTPEIVRSWEMWQATGDHRLTGCNIEGSGYTVPGTSGHNVLADCALKNTIQELDDYDGVTSAEPPLEVKRDAGSCDDSDFPWYRAHPLLGIGDY